jgi:PhnB protein
MATVKTVTPHLVVKGGKAAVEFYKAAFGATAGRVVSADDGARLMHADILVGDSRFCQCDEFPEHKDECGGVNSGSPKSVGGVSVSMQMEVSNCDEEVAQAVAAGATVIMPPSDAFRGDRYAQVLDPFGHLWAFSHTLKKAG